MGMSSNVIVCFLAHEAIQEGPSKGTCCRQKSFIVLVLTDRSFQTRKKYRLKDSFYFFILFFLLFFAGGGV